MGTGPADSHLQYTNQPAGSKSCVGKPDLVCVQVCRFSLPHNQLVLVTEQDQT